jgi:DNA mismatch endonuclease, patch repair protein
MTPRAIATDPARSALMKRIRRERTTPEDAVGELLRDLGVRMRRNVRDLPGSPDFANKRRKVAIFVHGCFWHAHPGCDNAKIPRKNRAFWVEKFTANRSRDRAKERALRSAGYTVVVIWQCRISSASTRSRLRSVAGKSES